MYSDFRVQSVQKVKKYARDSRGKYIYRDGKYIYRDWRHRSTGDLPRRIERVEIDKDGIVMPKYGKCPINEDLF